MARENQKEKEKLFSEKIDVLMAGGELKTDASAGEDVSSALDFARKMIAATPEPSPAFEARLRAKLLQKLAENKAKEKSWVWRLFPRQPVWQAVAATVLVVMVGVVVWVSGVLNPSEPAEPSKPLIVSNILKVEADTDKNAYLPGETVKIEVALENVTSGPLKLEQFPPILSVMETKSRQPVFTFGAGEDSKTLMPGEVATFAVSWNQRDEAGRRVAGDYYIELEDVNSGSQAIKLTFSKPVTFSVPAAGGNIGKIYRTVSLNQSQTVNGITVALQKLELADKGSRLTAIISAPPDYNQNRRTGDYSALAFYYFDRGWANDAGLSSVEYSRAEMKHTWYLTEPISKETEELFFIIMNIGKWEGPWQFTIPLPR